MADYIAVKIDDMEAIYGGGFHRARGELGVSSFGMQVMDFPAGFDQYPEHDHSEDGQEEVYVVLSGTAEIDIEGEKMTLDPSTMVRVSPGTKRRIATTDQPARILAIGGIPGKPYEPAEFSELGAPDPMAG
jgi:mannose-6-phosphate isomerase-like protein (cupin superfamily)